MTTRRFISIKTQFVLIAMLLVALSSTLWGVFAWKTERNLLYSNLENEGRQMLTSLSSPIINALLYEEMGVIEEGGLLDNFIEEIMKNSSLKVISAFVTDQNGKVLAHNQYTEYGKQYNDLLTRAAITEGRYQASLQKQPGQSESMLNMAMPLHIYQKSWGALRVVVSTAPLEAQLQGLAKRIAATSLAFFLLGMAASYLIGRSMARPLQRLSEIMASVSTDNLLVELPPDRPDEIGKLQESFRTMLERLRQSEAERKRAVTQLVQSEKLASLGKIVAGVAHEVNNPLGAINASIYNLEQKSGNQLRNMEIIKQGVERIERIVRQLSDFSRTASLELQPLASDSFFNECAEFSRVALKRFDVQLATEDRCTPPIKLQLDKGKIQQVLLNLLFNAAQASPPRAKIHLSAQHTHDYYQLEVADQGTGIPTEAQRTVFDIFYTTKQAGEGTGIGLAICKSIVEMHGGTITFTSCPGKTVFTVSLPLIPTESCYEFL